MFPCEASHCNSIRNAGSVAEHNTYEYLLALSLTLIFKVVKLLLWRWIGYLSAMVKCISVSVFYCLLLDKSGGLQCYLKKPSCFLSMVTKNAIIHDETKWFHVLEVRITLSFAFCLLLLNRKLAWSIRVETTLFLLPRSSKNEKIAEDWTAMF